VGSSSWWPLVIEAPLPFRVETIALDLPAVAASFARRLHDAGVPAGPDRATRFADALALVKPSSRRRLYWTARSVFLFDVGQLKAFDAVFAEVFGVTPRTGVEIDADAQRRQAPPDERRSSMSRSPATGVERSAEGTPASVPAPAAGAAKRPPALEQPVPVVASDEEVLRVKRFDALAPDELVALYRLMAQLRIAAPERRTRRAARDRHGERVDLRRTLRGSLRTGGDPIRLARRRRRVLPRRVVLLCDISGSMEPYARAYLQFLTCAAGGLGSHPPAEAFAFATRLTRLTRALHSRNPERAIQRAAATAPDWSSGTRIGEALKTFNDRYGRRGMARGAVVVILSDGWERGDPALVDRELARLRRLAYRIVWVNPRVSAPGFAPRAGGMVAALPHCDALVSGHSLEALGEVVRAIGAQRGEGDASGVSWSGIDTDLGGEDDETEDEPWASAGGWGPRSGSSVAMPSGYGPSRGIAGAVPGEFGWRRTRRIGDA
jgi:uncharacterized protein